MQIWIWLLSTVLHSPHMQVAQVAAKTLGIPIELVKVKPSNTLTNPNGQATGGSITSELNCLVSSSLYSMLFLYIYHHHSVFNSTYPSSKLLLRFTKIINPIPARKDCIFIIALPWVHKHTSRICRLEALCDTH